MSPLPHFKSTVSPSSDTTPHYPHPVSDLFSVITDSHISCEARLLYVILTEMAWTKRYCWPSIPTQAKYLGRSEDSICRYHKELEALGLLHVDRDGPRNYYYPRSVPGHSRVTRTDTTPPTRNGAGLTIKQEPIKHVQNVPHPLPAPPHITDTRTLRPPENDNVQNVVSPYQTQDSAPEPLLGPAPSGNKTPIPPRPRKIFNVHLLTEILELTGDLKSKGCWISVINQVPEDQIRYALGCLRLTLNDGTPVERPGAYLLAIITANNPCLTFKAGKYRSQSIHAQSSQSTAANIPYKSDQHTTHRFHDWEQDAAEPLNTEALVKGWKVLYEPGDVSLVLNQIQRCLPDWEVRTTWEALRRERPTDSEASLLGDFLELAAFKVQFQATEGTQVTNTLRSAYDEIWNRKQVRQ